MFVKHDRVRMMARILTKPSFFWFHSIKSWVDKMQEDLVTLAKTASGVTQLADVSVPALFMFCLVRVHLCFQGNHSSVLQRT